NTAADHVTVINSALAGLPGAGWYRVGKKVLIRMDGAGGTKTTLQHCVKRGLSYSGQVLLSGVSGLCRVPPGWVGCQAASAAWSGSSVSVSPACRAACSAAAFAAASASIVSVVARDSRLM